MGRACLRWTADTERGFLYALKQTGQVTLAAAAIGRRPDSCYARRKTAPAFAAAWDETVAQAERERQAARLAAVTAAGPLPAPLTRTRTDGWTQQRQRHFLRALSDTGRYGEAAARVGLSYEAVRAFRARSPEFQAACDKALADGGVSLEEAAYVRATEGWEEEVWKNGQLVGRRRRYSDTLARTLLTRDAPAKAGRAVAGLLTDEEVTAELMKRLDLLAASIARDERRAQLAWADEMVRRGLAP